MEQVLFFVLNTCRYGYILDPELNAGKLQALSKILQSDFCRAVREVYEHMYDTGRWNLSFGWKLYISLNI